MSALFSEPMAIPLDAQIACVAREIAMRERCYPRWVKDHKLTQAKSDAELAGMHAVLRTLQGLKEAEPTR